MNLTFPYTQNNNNVWLTNTGMPLREHFQLENSMEQTPIQFSTSVGPKKKKSWFFLCKSVNRREIWLLSSFSDRRIKLDPAHLLFKDDRRIGGGGRGKERRHDDDFGVSWFGSAKVGTATTIYVKRTRRVINMKLKRIRFKCRWDGKLKDLNISRTFFRF